VKAFIGKIRDRHNALLMITLFVLCTGVIVFLFPREGRFKYEFEEGKTWKHETLKAPFDFAIRKSQAEIDSSKKEIQNRTPPVYEMDEVIRGLNIRKFREAIESEWSASSKSQEGGRVLGEIFISARRDSINKARHLELGEDILNSIYAQGIADIRSDHAGSPQINLVKGSVSNVWKINDLLTIETAAMTIEERLKRGGNVDQEFLGELLSTKVHHNVHFNSHLSQLTLADALEEVSLFKGKVSLGDIIVTEGQLVSKEKYQELNSFKITYEKQIGNREGLLIVLLGQIVLVALCMAAMGLFLSMHYPEAISLPSRVLFLLALTLLAIIMAKFALKFDFLNLYLAPICIVPIIVRVFYDGKMALFMHVVVVFIISFIAPNPFEFVFLQVFAGILLLYGIRNLRRRSQFFNSAFVLFISYALTFFGLNILHEGTFKNIDWIIYAWFGGNALLSLFAYPLIYLFEKAFGFLSEVSLLELTDSNNPLLRELNEKAPGTFQHTLQVSNLAEEAIRVIDGDPLLMRAGALYHDIGKMAQPEYFIENQRVAQNPHDELAPEESSGIIINHVIEGIEIARKNNLPDPVVDFIRTHHGTTRTEYFYRKAAEVDPEIDSKIFQYPGPKPYSKETAVLMMADAVEAASRSMKEHSQASLTSLIDSIIDRQIQLDQFSNSDVTFADINRIKKVFVKKLMNIYHVRIEYPEATA